MNIEMEILVTRCSWINMWELFTLEFAQYFIHDFKQFDAAYRLCIKKIRFTIEPNRTNGLQTNNTRKLATDLKYKVKVPQENFQFGVTLCGWKIEKPKSKVPDSNLKLTPPPVGRKLSHSLYCDRSNSGPVQ